MGAPHLADPPERRNGAGAKNAVVLEVDGKPAGYALYRITMSWEGGSSIGHAQVVEAMGDSPARPCVRLGGSCSGSTGSEYPARCCRSVIPSSSSCSHAATPEATRGMGSGAGSSTSAPTLRAAPTSPVGCARDRGPFLPENAGRWRLAGGEALRRDAEADLALSVTELGLPSTSEVSPFGSSNARSLVGKGGRRRRPVRRALFRTDVKPWCPEIF